MLRMCFYGHNCHHSAAENRLIFFAAEEETPLPDGEPLPIPARKEDLTVKPLNDLLSASMLDLVKATNQNEPSESETTASSKADKKPPAPEKTEDAPGTPAIEIPKDIEEMFSAMERACGDLERHLEILERRFREDLSAQSLPTEPEEFHALAKESAALGGEIVEDVKSLSEQTEELKDAFEKIMDMLRYAPDLAAQGGVQLKKTESKKFVQSFIGSATFLTGSVAVFQALSYLAKPIMALQSEGLAGFGLMCAVTTAWFTASTASVATEKSVRH